MSKTIEYTGYGIGAFIAVAVLLLIQPCSSPSVDWQKKSTSGSHLNRNLPPKPFSGNQKAELGLARKISQCFNKEKFNAILGDRNRKLLCIPDSQKSSFLVKIVHEQNDCPVKGAEVYWLAWGRKWACDNYYHSWCYHDSIGFANRVISKGLKKITNKDGLARIPKTPWKSTVVATWKNEIGWRTLSHGGNSAFTLKIKQFDKAEIEVVDNIGFPVSGAPVVVFKKIFNHVYRRMQQGVTNEHGKFYLLKTPNTINSELYACVPVISEAPPLKLINLGVQGVVCKLTMPECGKVVVNIKSSIKDDRAHAFPNKIILEIIPAVPANNFCFQIIKSRSQVATSRKEGVVFNFIGLNQQLDIKAKAMPPSFPIVVGKKDRVYGPSKTSLVKKIEFDISFSDFVNLKGKCVTPKGEPIVNSTFGVYLKKMGKKGPFPRGGFRDVVITDSSGNFKFCSRESIKNRHNLFGSFIKLVKWESTDRTGNPVGPSSNEVFFNVTGASSTCQLGNLVVSDKEIPCIKGYVRGKSNEPIENTLIKCFKAQGDNRSPSSQIATAKTDSFGKFNLSVPNSVSGYCLIAVKRGYCFEDTHPVFSPSEDILIKGDKAAKMGLLVYDTPTSGSLQLEWKIKKGSTFPVSRIYKASKTTIQRVCRVIDGSCFTKSAVLFYVFANENAFSDMQLFVNNSKLLVSDFSSLYSVGGFSRLGVVKIKSYTKCLNIKFLKPGGCAIHDFKLHAKSPNGAVFQFNSKRFLGCRGCVSKQGYWEVLLPSWVQAMKFSGAGYTTVIKYSPKPTVVRKYD